MYAVEKVSSFITRGVYTVSGPFHPFGGAVDIIVVQQKDGSFKSSPWYVRLGKFQGVLKTKEKVVNIAVNGVEAGFHMYLDHKGEAYFLKDADPNDEGGEFVTSPMSSGDEMDDQARRERLRKIHSIAGDRPIVATEVGKGKIITRRQTTILERVFGRKSIKENGSSSRVDRVSSMERAEIAAELLETKWSTNLSTRGTRAGTGSRFEPPVSNGNQNGSVDEGESSQTASQMDSYDHDEPTNSHHESLDESFSSPTAGSDNLQEANDHDLVRIRVEEEVVEIHTCKPGDSTNATASTSGQMVSESLSNIPTADSLNMSSTNDSVHDSIHSHIEELHESLEKDTDKEMHIQEITSHEVVEIHRVESGSTNDSTAVVSNLVTQDSHRVDLHSTDSASPITHTVEVITERYEVSPIGPPQNGGQEGAAILSNFETEESSHAMSTISPGRGHDVADISLIVSAELQGSSEEVSTVKGELISVERLQHEDSNSQISQADCPQKEVFVDTVAGDNIDLPSEVAFKGDLDGSHTSGFELSSSKSEIIHPEELTKNVAGEERSNGEVDLSCTQTWVEEDEGREHSSLSTTTVLQQSNLTNDVNSESVQITTYACNVNEEDEVQDTAARDNSSNPCSTAGVDKETSMPAETAEKVVTLSENLEENIQFQFSDAECSNDKEANKEPETTEATGTGQHQLFIRGGDREEHIVDQINQEKNFGSHPDSSEHQTNPITIPGNQINTEDTNPESRSLPILRSHILELERSDRLHQLSHSLNSNHENDVGNFVRKTNTVSSESDTEGASNVEENLVAPDLADSTVPAPHDKKVNSFNPIVELSLCKHLLYEGMGEDAAREAFDSEKVTLEKFRALGQSLTKSNKLVVKIAGHYFPWDAAAPIVLGMASFGEDEVFESRGMINVEQADKKNASGPIVPSGGNWKLWPFSFRRQRTMSTVSTDREGAEDTSFSTPETEKNSNRDTDEPESKNAKRKVRSLTPTSEELASLNLREGSNVVTFTFWTAMLGKQQVDARIYLWQWNSRVVISDVDGTITKSDVLGQFMPLVGVDWSQTGVAHLFSAIKENGYQLLFLSARAISQAHLTRQFLFNLKQDGKALPDGPVVISPDGLFPSLYREVIRRAPHEFKISCLETIKALFPADCNPFYAGFGNRDTDELSYRKVGIPMGKIFIINPKGEVAVNHQVDTKSYSSLSALVNGMFPSMSSSEQEDYNTWNYWKLPLPDVD